MAKAELIVRRSVIMVVVSIILTSCTGRAKKENQNSNAMAPDTLNQYGYNLEFLKKYVQVIELKNDKAAVALIPAWQGRVMTSTAEGSTGFSFGWINRELIKSGRIQPHINAFGGEERLWLGPEGGQFSIFFKKGAKFVFDNWQTPAFLDTTPFQVISRNDSSALFACNVETENYSGTNFKFRLEREVTVLTEKIIRDQLGINVAGVNCVAYRSVNIITNKGDNEWTKESGQLSVWMLGMFNPSPSVVVAIPFKPGDEKLIGPRVNDNYFGKIAPDRLKVSGNHIFFRADGKSRGKIGLPPLRATGIMGSFDAANNILTLLICRFPEGKTEFVNSAWQIQENPFSGDALNSYNDGPLEDGSQMGPFYELEASSPAAALKPGEDIEHIQFTLHLTGNRKLLNDISVKALGISLEKIENAFK
jgi:hypothetical protein